MTATDLPIETFRKKPITVDTMLWDGTPKRAEAIKAWVGQVPGSGSTFGFLPPGQYDDEHVYARLWVAHNRDCAPLPIGHRVVAEIDGSGYYPLSPEGLSAGYEAESVEDQIAALRALGAFDEENNR